MRDYKVLSDEELLAEKRKAEAAVVKAKEIVREIAREQELRVAKAKLSKMSPKERENLKQVIAAESIETTTKVYSSS